MKGQVDIGRCFNDAIEVYRVHWLMLFVVSLVMGLLGMVTLSILSGPLTAGFYLICLNLLRGRKNKVDIEDLFSQFSRFLPLAGLFYLQMLIIFGGTLLLIIPGIILSVMLLYAFFIAADLKQGAVDSIKISWKLVATKGIGINFVVYIIFLAILLGSMLIPYLGWILGYFASPFVSLILASAYIQQVDEDAGQMGELFVTVENK